MTHRPNADFDIDPNSTNGIELAGILNRMIEALDSQNSGAARPTYLIAGGLWVDTSGTDYILKLFNGTTDIVLISASDAMPKTGGTFSGEVKGVLPSSPADLTRKDWVETAISNAIAAATSVVPVGGIIMYNGAYSAIPTNWKLCNGADGTPDLRNKFVMGADIESSLEGEGGSADAVVVSHNHNGNTTDSGNHKHQTLYHQRSRTKLQPSSTEPMTSGASAFGDNDYITTRPDTGGLVPNVAPTSTNGNHHHAIHSQGVSGTGKNNPKYFKLAYIQRKS